MWGLALMRVSRLLFLLLVPLLHMIAAGQGVAASIAIVDGDNTIRRLQNASYLLAINGPLCSVTEQCAKNGRNPMLNAGLE